MRINNKNPFSKPMTVDHSPGPTRVQVPAYVIDRMKESAREMRNRIEREEAKFEIANNAYNAASHAIERQIAKAENLNQELKRERKILQDTMRENGAYGNDIEEALKQWDKRHRYLEGVEKPTTHELEIEADRWR